MGQADSKPSAIPILELKSDLDEAAEPIVAAVASAGTPSAAALAHSTFDGSDSQDGVGANDPAAAPASPAIAKGSLPVEDYRLEETVLGEGAFAKVKLATSKRTGDRVAVKIIKRKKLNERAETLLQREVLHHEKLRHENIVRLHGWIKGPKKYYLVMEYCPHGDLLRYVNEQGILSDKVALQFFGDLMEGIHFCHALGIHHRDLKLENLMLGGSPARLRVKIADFGLSELQQPPTLEAGVSNSRTFCGSPLYAAPELMTEGATPHGYDASRSDIWSCGIVLYALLSSALPFDAEDINSLVRLVQRGVPNSPVPESRGADAVDLVSRMLSVNPATRPSAADVLKSKWLKGPIRASSTMADLETIKKKAEHQPSLPATREEKAEKARAEPRRRGASATSQYFKALKEEVRDDEASRAAARTAADMTLAPVLEKLPVAAAEAAEVAAATDGADCPSGEAHGGDLAVRKGGARMTQEEKAEIQRLKEERKNRIS